MARTTTRRRAGDIMQHDVQADIWQTSYKLIERVPGQPGTWVTEQLPPSEDVLERVFSDYAAHEATCQPGCHTCTYHSPVWDKTWAECDDSNPEDRPRITGWTTVQQELDRELARLDEWAGRRSTVKFVSRAQWAQAF